MLLIGFTGKARSGKDTIGKHLIEQHGFGGYAMARPLKMMLGAIGYPEERYQTTEEKESIIPLLGVSYRHLAQTLGTEWMRKCVAEDGWVLLAREAIRTARDVGLAGLVITDIRFENEAAIVRDEGGVVVHVISNRNFALSAATQAHSSEAGVAVANNDRLIFNYYDQPSAASLAALHATVSNVLAGLLPFASVPL